MVIKRKWAIAFLLLAILILVMLTATSCHKETSAITGNEDIYQQITTMSDAELLNEIETRTSRMMTEWRDGKHFDFMRDCTIVLMCQNELDKRAIIDAINKQK